MSLFCIQLVMTLDIKAFSSLVSGGCYNNCVVHYIFIWPVCYAIVA